MSSFTRNFNVKSFIIKWKKTPVSYRYLRVSSYKILIGFIFVSFQGLALSQVKADQCKALLSSVASSQKARQEPMLHALANTANLRPHRFDTLPSGLLLPTHMSSEHNKKLVKDFRREKGIRARVGKALVGKRIHVPSPFFDFSKGGFIAEGLRNVSQENRLGKGLYHNFLNSKKHFSAAPPRFRLRSERSSVWVNYTKEYNKYGFRAPDLDFILGASLENPEYRGLLKTKPYLLGLHFKAEALKKAQREYDHPALRAYLIIYQPQLILLQKR